MLTLGHETSSLPQQKLDPVSLSKSLHTKPCYAIIPCSYFGQVCFLAKKVEAPLNWSVWVLLDAQSIPHHLGLRQRSVMKSFVFRGVSIAVLMMIGLPIVAQVPTYTLQDLGDLDGGSLVSLNNFGVIVGNRIVAGENQPFLIQPGGTLQDIPGSLGIGAGGINDRGEVIGFDGQIPVTWTASNGFTQLDTPPGFNRGNGDTEYANGINDSGTVVGGWNVYPSTSHAFYWTPTSGLTEINPLPGYSENSAAAINNQGQIAGTSLMGGAQAYIWSAANGMVGLGQNTVAVAINNLGEVLGTSTSISGQAFVWTSTSGATNLPSGFYVSAKLNDSGAVVGTTDDANGSHAAIWTSQGGLQSLTSDLNATGSGWNLQTAIGINDLGQIVGMGVNGQGQTHAYLLTPQLVTQRATQTPGLQFTSAPATTYLGVLDVYDPKTGQFDDPASTSSSNPGYINPNEPTIVMTHGWNNSPSTWAAGMATLINYAIQNHSGGAGTPVNIVAWDWSNYADTGNGLLNLGLATKAVPNEGNALGAQLAAYLGTNYQLPMHYLGHSLGTMVNAGHAI
jgi:probable HAF family extracellular repeat protein